MSAGWLTQGIFSIRRIRKIDGTCQLGLIAQAHCSQEAHCLQETHCLQSNKYYKLELEIDIFTMPGSVPFKPRNSCSAFCTSLRYSSLIHSKTHFKMNSQTFIYTRHQLRNNHLSRQSSTRTFTRWITHPFGQPKQEHLHPEVYLQFRALTLMQTDNTTSTWSKNLHRLAWMTKYIRTSSTY